MTGVETTHVVGEARVQAIFNLTGIEKRHVAGCMMTEGMILKDSVLRVWRKKELLLKKGKQARQQSDIHTPVQKVSISCSACPLLFSFFLLGVRQ